MIIWGYHAVEESLRSEARGSLLISRSGPHIESLKDLARQQHIPIKSVSAKELNRITGHDHHQGVVLLVEPSRIESLRHREAVPETEAAPTVEVPVGTVRAVEEFCWAAVPAADLYRVTLYDGASDVVWQVDARDTHVALPDTVRLEPGALYLWQLEARVGWDRWVSSELVRFRISEP